MAIPPVAAGLILNAIGGKMTKYHKIQTVYNRDPDDNFKTVIPGDWSLPEFDILKKINWIWTEKIDGTNIRVMWDGSSVSFAGKTDNSQIPPRLLKKLQEIFTEDLMNSKFFGSGDICLYGEGYGAKIQKGGGNYIPDGVDFILFDIKVGNWWLKREDVISIADSMDIMVVPEIERGPLSVAIDLVERGFLSTVSKMERVAEGLVMRPPVELFDRGGRRIICKIKHKDFKK